MLWTRGSDQCGRWARRWRLQTNINKQIIQLPTAKITSFTFYGVFKTDLIPTLCSEETSVFRKKKS